MSAQPSSQQASQFFHNLRLGRDCGHWRQCRGWNGDKDADAVFTALFREAEGELGREGRGGAGTYVRHQT